MLPVDSFHRMKFWPNANPVCSSRNVPVFPAKMPSQPKEVFREEHIYPAVVSLLISKRQTVRAAHSLSRQPLL